MIETAEVQALIGIVVGVLIGYAALYGINRWRRSRMPRRRYGRRR